MVESLSSFCDGVVLRFGLGLWWFGWFLQGCGGGVRVGVRGGVGFAFEREKDRVYIKRLCIRVLKGGGRRWLLVMQGCIRVLKEAAKVGFGSEFAKEEGGGEKVISLGERGSRESVGLGFGRALPEPERVRERPFFRITL